MVWRKENADVTEEELANALFNRRFSTRLFESEYQEKTRIKSYFDVHKKLNNLVDMCVASAMVEFKFSPTDKKIHKYIFNVISAELFKLGYRIQSKKEST